MFSVRVIIASLLVVVAVANPVHIPRAADCSTIFSGILAADASGVYKSLTLNAENQVAYHGDAKNPLHVDFKECQSLESGEPHDVQKSGVLYVPSHGKCISITNQGNAVGPYYTTLTTCGAAYQIPYAQRWVLREDQGNSIFWSGDSDEEGTILQGGCGLLGITSHENGVPVNTHSNKQITVGCFNGFPFQLAKNAH